MTQTRFRTRRLALGAATLSILAACATSTDSTAPKPATLAPDANDAAVSVFQPQVAQRDAKFDLPTITWLGRPIGSEFTAKPGSTVKDVAWSTLRRLKDAYRLHGEALTSAVVTQVHDTGDGVRIARFGQNIDGVEVFTKTLNIAMTKDLEPVAATGNLAAATRRVKGATFKLDAAHVVARALADASGRPFDAASLEHRGLDDGGYSNFAILTSGNDAMRSAPRAKKVWYPHPKGIEAAFYVEVDVSKLGSTDSELRAYVISAADGSTLFTKNLTESDSYSYRVWAEPGGDYRPYGGPQGFGGLPHPTGIPDGYQAPFVAPNLVTLANVPFSKNDPWLPANATALTGNNVDAYADLIAPDGFNAAPPPASGDAGADGAADAAASDAGADGGTPTGGDIRTDPTAAGKFDRIFDLTKNPDDNETNIKAATTQLFYNVNFLHDWFYDSGWDEASGNPQKDNFGRGGVGNDPILAEAQDYSGRNNANASTPADGKSPRIQMFVFDPHGTGRVNILTPAPRLLDAQVAEFGPKSFTLTGPVVVADDGAAPATDACTPITNTAAVTGKIVLIDRGTCTFVVKAQHAQAAGAIGVLIANNAPFGLPSMGGTEPAITIPALGIPQAGGVQIKAGQGQGVTVTLTRDAAGIARDGSLDNPVVAHEWGHVLSNRLIGNAAGISNIQARGMGEGWGDFSSLLMRTRAEDASVPSNANYSGTYSAFAYVDSGGNNDGYYFGGRRVPYSTDFSKNGLTYKHTQDGVPLPATVPTAGRIDGANNSEVHNTGEVWATMLWECYAALLRDTGRLTFAEARSRMKGYLIASLKLTPNSPTILEARDAVLAAAYAKDNTDYRLFAEAFARRGAGVGAIAAPRESADNIGVTESFATGNDLQIVDISLDDSKAYCDRDGVVDNGETGKLTIKVKNIGLRPLGNTTAFISSPNPSLRFANGGNVAFPNTNPFETVTATVDVSLSAAAPISRAAIEVALRDPGLANLRTIYGTYKDVFNFDIAPATSATDSVDAATSLWTVAANQTLSVESTWRLVKQDGDRVWHMDDLASTSDHWATSPPLNVAATGDFSFTFSHRYSFEASDGTNYDGGVIEITSDNGTTWTDIGASAAPGYGGTLLDEGSDNPLKGRAAFVGVSAGYPAYGTTTVSLGAAYQGKTVQVRFRVGTDQGAGAPGWDLDDLAFTNITNKPFATRVADSAKCTNRAPVANAGPARNVAERSTVALAGSGTDADSNPLTYKWTQTAGPAVTLSSATVAAPTFTAPEVTGPTAVTFSLVVNDGTVDSEPATVTLTVVDANRAPVANAGATQTVAPGAAVTLNGTASADPDMDALTYAWSQISGPPVAITNANAASPTFTAPAVKATTTLWFSLVVSDGVSLSVPSTVGVTVDAGDAGATPTPTPTPTPPKSDAGQFPTVFDAGGSDDDGCAVGSTPTKTREGGFVLAGLGLALAAVRRRFRRNKA